MSGASAAQMCTDLLRSGAADSRSVHMAGTRLPAIRRDGRQRVIPESSSLSRRNRATLTGMRTLRRTAAVAAAAVTVAVLAACASSPADPSTDSSPAPAAASGTSTPAPTASSTTSAPSDATIETTPVSLEEWPAYLQRNRPASGTAASVCGEYEAAAAGFPLPLPDGYAFPADPASEASPAGFDCDVEDGTFYEPGFGLAAAFTFWSGATATAAVAAHDRGDDAAAAEHVAALQDGHASRVDEVLVPAADPEALPPRSHPGAVAAAGGDFSALEDEAAAFLQDSQNASIAAQAGDA